MSTIPESLADREENTSSEPIGNVAGKPEGDIATQSETDEPGGDAPTEGRTAP